MSLIEILSPTKAAVVVVVAADIVAVDIVAVVVDIVAVAAPSSGYE